MYQQTKERKTMNTQENILVKANIHQKNKRSEKKGGRITRVSVIDTKSYAPHLDTRMIGLSVFLIFFTRILIRDMIFEK